MIKEYTKIIVMSVVLLVLIIGVVVITTTDLDLGFANILSFAGVSDKKLMVDTLTLQEKQ